MKITFFPEIIFWKHLQYSKAYSFLKECHTIVSYLKKIEIKIKKINSEKSIFLQWKQLPTSDSKLFLEKFNQIVMFLISFKHPTTSEIDVIFYHKKITTDSINMILKILIIYLTCIHQECKTFRNRFFPKNILQIIKVYIFLLIFVWYEHFITLETILYPANISSYQKNLVSCKKSFPVNNWHCWKAASILQISYIWEILMSSTANICNVAVFAIKFVFL